MENIGEADPFPGIIVSEQCTAQVELKRHFPEHQMVGHGVRSTSRCSRSFDPQCVGPHRSSYESITEWRPEDGGEDSDFSAVMNLVTCAIGSGIVYLPYAAGECGLILALLLICLLAWASAHSTIIVGTVLLMARNIAKKVGNEGIIETLADMSRVIWGAVGFWITAFIVYFELYLAITVFMGILATTMNELIAEFIQNSQGTQDEKSESPIEFWWLVASVFGFMALVMPLCWLKSMGAISKMSIAGVIANVVILICIVISTFADTGSVADKTGLKYSISQAYINGISPYVNTNSKLRESVAKSFGPNGDSHCAAFGTVDECNAADGCQFFMFTDKIGGCIGQVCEALTEKAACNDTDGCAYTNGACVNEGQIRYQMFDFGNMWSAYGIFGFSYGVAIIAPSLLAGMKNPDHLGRVAVISHFIICTVYCAVILVSFFAWGNGVISWSGDGKSDVSQCDVAVADCPDDKCLTFTFPTADAASFPDMRSGEQCVPKVDFNVYGANVIKNDFMPSLVVQTIATVALLVSIVSSVPVVFFSIALMVESLLKKKWPNISDFLLRYVNRTIFMAICVAPIFPLNLDYPSSDVLAELQGFVGAVGVTTSCVILPNVLFFCLTAKFPKGHKFRSGKVLISIGCAVAIAVGFFSMVVGILADGLGLFGVEIFYL